MDLSANLSLRDVFTLCRQGLIPKSCVILEITGRKRYKELWPGKEIELIVDDDDNDKDKDKGENIQ